MDAVIALEYGHGDGRYEPVSIGGGAWLPDRFRVRLNDPARPLVVDVDFAVQSDGTLRVVAAMQVPRDGVVVHADDFRVPIDRLAEAAITVLTLEGPDRPPGRTLTAHEMLVDVPPVGGIVGDVLCRRRRRVLTAELLGEVARVFEDARARGTGGRRAVAEHWIVPENTARNWIRAARQRGLISTT